MDIHKFGFLFAIFCLLDNLVELSSCQWQDLTNDPIKPEGEVVRYNAAHVSPQRVAYTGEPVRSEPGFTQGAQGFGSTSRRRTQVVDGGYVARRLAELAPIQHEDIVSTAAEVSWENTRQVR